MRDSLAPVLSSSVAWVSSKQLLDAGVGLARERLLDERQHRLVGVAGQLLGRGQPRRAVGR